jgi:hypothetical protein
MKLDKNYKLFKHQIHPCLEAQDFYKKANQSDSGLFFSAPVLFQKRLTFYKYKSTKTRKTIPTSCGRK